VSIFYSGNDPSIASITPKPISLTTTSNGQYTGLPVLTLYLIPSASDIYVRSLAVNINSAGQGSVNTAYLYQGNISGGARPVATAVVKNGQATFVINPSDPLQVQLYKNVTSSGNNPNNLLTVKVDISGLAHSGDNEVITASANNIMAITSLGQNVNVTGNANGNIITVQQP
jgi:hypothetical protein